MIASLLAHFRQRRQRAALRATIDGCQIEARSLAQFRLLDEASRAWDYLQTMQRPGNPQALHDFEDQVVDKIGSIVAAYSADKDLATMFSGTIPPAPKVVECLENLGFQSIDKIPEADKTPPVSTVVTPEMRHTAAILLIGAFMKDPRNATRFQDPTLYYAAYFSTDAQRESKRESQAAQPAPPHPHPPQHEPPTALTE